jgi:lipoprotein signal peptidase
MTKNRLMWMIAVIGTVLLLLVQYCLRVSIGSRFPAETIPLLPGVLHLTYFQGGVAFSFTNSKQVLILIRIGSILFFAAITFFISRLLAKYSKKITKTLQIGIGLFFAGAISNAVEYAVFGENAAFIDFRQSQVPLLNFSDISIYLGQAISIASIAFLGIKFAIKKWRGIEG